MLNGLDLFSGIGGMSIALNEWVRPVAYCEIDPYCQAALFSNMSRGSLVKAPIWDDIRTLEGDQMWRDVDIIYGGFPCQDISVAAHGKGLDGERSGLYWQIHRLAKEIKPAWIFLENVPAICTKGAWDVVSSLAEIGYDCRWCTLSAASIGAPHIRERWFLLAHSNTQHSGSSSSSIKGSDQQAICDSSEGANSSGQSQGMDSSQTVANSRCEPERSQIESKRSSHYSPRRCGFWDVEPEMGRVADGIPNRSHRIRALGNAVVAWQAQEAFKILIGLNG